LLKKLAYVWFYESVFGRQIYSRSFNNLNDIHDRNLARKNLFYEYRGSIGPSLSLLVGTICSSFNGKRMFHAYKLRDQSIQLIDITTVAFATASFPTTTVVAEEQQSSSGLRHKSVQAST
jgi:hypothetical protein